MDTQKQEDKEKIKSVALTEPVKSVIKQYTPAETLKLILNGAMMDYDVSHILSKLSEAFPKYMDGTEKEKKEVKEGFLDDSGKLMMAFGLETHLPVAEASGTLYKPYAKEMAIRITKEYDCKDPSEKALADVVVTSYIKVLSFTKKFNGCMEAGEYLSDERTRYLTMLSKELDRANRQFTTALGMLRQFKNPSIEINVKAKTAFVSQNQQINATQEIKTNDPQ